MTARRVICRDCGDGGPWTAQPGRAIRCPTCIATFERKRNASRPHYRAGYKRRRRAALTRARYRCQVKGCTTPTDRLECHHVTPADPDSRLMVLCHHHHAETFRRTA